MSNLVKTTVAISDLKVGYTVEFNGQLLTVGKKDFTSEGGFRGDASKKTIVMVQFSVPTAFGIVLR